MRRQRVVALACVSVFVLSTSPGFRAQRPDCTPRDPLPCDPWTLDIWLKAIDAHRPGVFDEPAKTIAAMDDAKLWGVIADLRKYLMLERDMRVRKPDPAKPPEVSHGGVVLTLEQLDRILGIDAASDPNYRKNHILKLGTILHTDIAFLAPRRPSRDIGAGTRNFDNSAVAIVGQDGRFDATTQILLHVIIGRALLDLITPDPAADESVRAWYYATTAMLEGHQMFADARPHIQRALQLLPADPIILFYAGAFHEMLAGSSVQGVATAAASMGYNVPVLTPKAELQAARQFYATAVKMGSVDPELHLHIGRVNGLLGDHDEAIASLTHASSGLQEPSLQYDATLFLAAEYEALGRWDDARVSLLRASALFPKAQSALVALSRLRHRQGDRTGVIAPLELLFGLSGSDPARDDPWWQYSISHARNSMGLLTQARQRLAGDTP